MTLVPNTLATSITCPSGFTFQPQPSITGAPRTTYNVNIDCVNSAGVLYGTSQGIANQQACNTKTYMIGGGIIAASLLIPDLPIVLRIIGCGFGAFELIAGGIGCGGGL